MPSREQSSVDWPLLQGFRRAAGIVMRIGQPEAVLKVGANREEIVTTLATTISLNAGAAHVYSLHDSLKS
ncbi:hypothetical protein EMIT051CA3_50304 [Pseudomonas chlororaphis]